MPIPFIMPKVDMDQEKATIISWSKQDGDLVKQDETVLEVETEKVAMDIPAPATGTLAGIRYKAGDVVPIAEVIAYILKEGETLSDLPTEAAPVTPVAIPATPEPATVNPLTDTPIVAFSATPVAARIAKEHDLDLSLVPATGERIKREDVERFLESQKQVMAEKEPVFSGKVFATPAARRLAHETGIPLESLSGSGPQGRIQAVDVASAQTPIPVLSGERQAEIIPLVGMRQKIANRMQASFQEAPHIALTVEVDVTHLEATRQRMNALAAREQSGKISLTALLVKVTAWALERNPYINASLIDDQIHLWKDANIGVATALEDGLIVPVIQQSNQLSIRQIADTLTDLSTRARDNRLTLSDVQRGTFTISNLGMFGIRQFRAIINPPESAILAVSAVVRKPVVVDEQDSVAVRPIMSITISADHRVIDGVVAARFLADLVEGIEYPEALLY
jgi:pyruvate dehydrogenase E2 component (dihydrolipoamide acetyltransferase)